jgi:hypothetical protein
MYSGELSGPPRRTKTILEAITMNTNPLTRPTPEPVQDQLDPFWSPVVVRLATGVDRRALERLAQLDSAPLPGGSIMMGELHGRPVAAVSLADETVIADPFVRTSEIVELVRLRAKQLGPIADFAPAPRERRRSKASRSATKGLGPQVGSVLPMYRRLSQLILRTT